jgi:hypothetical protein
MRRRKYIYSIIFLYVLAVAIGVSTAMIKAPPSKATVAVTATYHCRNYFPVLRAVDTNCAANGWIAASPSDTEPIWGQTPGPAHRDSQYMLTDWNRWLLLWYGENTPVEVYDVYNSQGSGGYNYAGCGMIGAGVYGFCETYYHDS